MNPIQTYKNFLPDAARWAGRLLGLTPNTGLLPRKHCHFLTMPLRGVPSKHAEAAIQLHLKQLSLFAQTGFTFRLDDNGANVWYWDDAAARRILTAKHVQPCPESILRAPMESALRLSSCIEGFELEGHTNNGLYKSRWFANPPTPDERAIFCRDLGLSDTQTIAQASTPHLDSRPARGWVICSALAPRPSPVLLALLLTLIFSGVFAATQLSKIVKTDEAILQTSKALEQLKQQRSQITALEAQITELSPLHDALAQLVEHPQQIELLAAMAASNIVGEKSGAWLIGWSYQKDGLTLTIRLGENSRRADILARLEAAARVSELMLMPDPPTGSMVVRLRLNDARRAETREPAPATGKS